MISHKVYLIILFTILVKTSSSQTPANDPHWQLIFQDDFCFINPNVWEVKNNYLHGIKDDGTLAELSINMAENVEAVCKDDVNNDLLIKVKRADPKIIYHENGRTYTLEYSGAFLQTKQFFNYGYFEAKVAIPFGVSFHPAFWTWIKEGCDYKEIDIAEFWDGKYDNAGYYDKNSMTTGYFYDYGPSSNPHWLRNFVNDHTEYHVYGLQWTPNTLIWYIDNIPFRTEPNVGNSLNQKLRLILNFCIMADPPPNSNTPFPAACRYKYVKAYSLKENCSSVINQCNYNFNNPDNYVRQEINLGGIGCSNIVPNGAIINLRASNQISINGEFLIPLGASFLAEIDPCVDTIPCNP